MRLHVNTLIPQQSHVKVLLQVLDMQQEAQAVGQALPIVCSQHQGTTNLIKTAEDFDVYAKDGGCSLPCETRLRCGHACPRYLPSLYATTRHGMGLHVVALLQGLQLHL